MVKKAQAGLTGIILGVGIAVVLITFLAVLLGNMFDITEDDLTTIGVNTINEETFVVRNDTITSLAHSFIQEGTISIGNTSAVGLTNFTIDYDYGTVKLVSSSLVKNGSTMTTNYTWGAVEIRDSLGEGMVSSYDSYEKTTGYLGLIVLAVVIGLILTIVLGFANFGTGGRDSGPL